ncbi:MAG: ABC transporter substrate-binding protein [Ruminococcus flavefaciens]|nr:ABC transporter substrate-binding protein [Ruminococcus flavefaciens]
MKKNKKILELMALAVSAAFLMTACGTKDNAETIGGGTNADTAPLEGLVEEGKLIFVTDDAQLPMVFRDENNELQGFDYECGNAIAEYLGLEPVWITTTWDGLLPTLQSGKADAVTCGMYITEERKQAVDFCDSICNAYATIILREDNDTITKPEDLLDKKVGVTTATPNEDYLIELGVENIVSYNKVPDGIMDLKSGRIDAFILESLGAMYYANGNGCKTVSTGTDAFEVGIAVSKDAPQVRDAMNEALSELEKNGTLSDLMIKYFGTDEL